MLALLVADPFVELRAYMESHGTMPAVLVTILIGVLVIAISALSVELVRRLASKGQWTLVALFVLAYGAATWLWWNRTFGLLVILASLAYLFRRPLRALVGTLGRRLSRRKNSRSSDRD